MTKYKVTLTQAERDELLSITKGGTHSSKKIIHALILLNCDEGAFAEKISNEAVAKVLKIGPRTIDRLKKKFVEEGFEVALENRPTTRVLENRPTTRVYERKADGDVEAHLVALSCSKAPEGFARWSLRLLADKMVELNYVEGISYETVRRVPKKNELKPWKVKGWIIPPLKNSDFVAQMEQVLDVYKDAYNEAYPEVCMDESPKQLIKETRVAIEIKSGGERKEDYEYERCGVTNILMANEPLSGKRFVKITDEKKKKDWAEFVKEIADIHYPKATKIRLVMDNYGTHKAAALYETFEPQEAKRIWDRFEFIYTPKHGSWLNMAEIELHVLMGQCLNRRIDDVAVMKSEAAVWQKHRNNKCATINWQFKNEQARIKLKKIYPSIDE
ncbi:IS630 family transposase [Parafilimonas sp.]|uniref:IS630 family transposase n=1 Tax=Parafilimonas sp. TaxID=1969739 RepID=UPI0039E60945